MARSLRFGPGRVLTLVVIVGLLAAACGGGTKKATGTGGATTTSTEVTSSTAPPVTDTVAPGGTTTSTTANATVTTSRTATTVRRTTGTTAAAASTNTKGGISQVVSGTTTAPSKDIQSGGTLTFLKAGEITGFDPVVLQQSGSSDGPPATMVMDMLMYLDTATGSLVPVTADSLTSSDALVWTLKLKPNIKMSDGTAYDAAAVKFNWLRLQDPNNHASLANLANLIGTMDVIDAVTLKITLKAKNAQFPVAVYGIPFIGSPAAIQALGANFMNAPVGAGPFTLKSWVRDSQMVFVRNPNYWNVPKPYLDSVIIKPIIDESQRIQTFIAGQANFLFVGTASNADLVNKSNAGVVYPQILNGGINLLFNTKAKPFNDIRARQAVELAIDKVDYAKVVNSGLQEPLDSLFRHDSPFYDPTIIEPPYDPVKAQQLFDALAADTGGPLKFSITAFPVTNYQNSALYVQGTLNKFKNVSVSVVTESSTLHITNCTAGTFETACGYNLVFVDPEPAWTTLYTCNANPSPTGWCNPKFDAAVLDNQTTLDAKQRIADIKDAQREYYREVPSFSMERRYSWLFGAPNVQDVQWVNDGLLLLDRVWIKNHG